MVVDGQLKEGDFLPSEAELMSHFGVSRPMLREAVRVLDPNAWSRCAAAPTGAGCEYPARKSSPDPQDCCSSCRAPPSPTSWWPAPPSNRWPSDYWPNPEHPRCSTSWRRCWPKASRRDGGRVSSLTTGDFHRRVVELSGNTTLAIIAGMLHEITVRHTAFAIKERRTLSKADYELVRSYRRLMQLMRAGDAAAAGGPLAQAPRYRTYPC